MARVKVRARAGSGGARSGWGCSRQVTGDHGDQLEIGRSHLGGVTAAAAALRA